MTELPKGWESVELGEVADVIAGQSPPGSDVNDAGVGVPFFQGKTEFGDRYPEARKWTTNPQRMAALGDVLLSVRAPVGPTNLAPSDCAIGRGLMAVRQPSFADRYLLWVLRATADQLKLFATGSTFEAVTGPVVRQHTVPVAPLAEQERIVAAIEEAFSKLDAGEAGLRTVRQLLKRMREAVLAAAVTGRLVPQVPAETPATKLLADLGVVGVEIDGVPPGWARARLGQLARVGSGTTPNRGTVAFWQDGTVPWITSGLITHGVIREAREFVTHRAVSETSLRLWPPGTLLVAMYGEGQTRGRCAELAIEATCNQACAAIVLHDQLRNYKDFVRVFFDANYSTNRRLASGGVQPNLNAGLIKDMVLALPPAEEQRRIVSEVARQVSFIDACERAVGAGLARSATLRRTVLRAAFKGRLVPQDPTDEPASVLLERISAERSARQASTSGRHRKKSEAS